MKYRIIPVTHYQQNCSLVWCEQSGSAALIDPGGDSVRLLAAVAEEGVKLEQILLTHGHVDHVSAAGELASHLGIPVVGPHQEDAFWLAMLPDQALQFGFPATEELVPDRWLSDGETVHVGTVALQVLHCPGHTPGHIVFFDPQSRTAFVGDVLFNGSIGRTDFPRGNYNTLLQSIHEKLLPLGDDVTFIPGHGPNSTFGEERRHNPFLNRD